jgi:hypothetical protein
MNAPCRKTAQRIPQNKLNPRTPYEPHFSSRILRSLKSGFATTSNSGLYTAFILPRRWPRTEKCLAHHSTYVISDSLPRARDNTARHIARLHTIFWMRMWHGQRWYDTYYPIEYDLDRSTLRVVEGRAQNMCPELDIIERRHWIYSGRECTLNSS